MTGLAIGAGPNLRRSTTGKMNGKTFVVAVDGSKMSKRAVQLAAWFHSEASRDKMRFVCVTGSKMSGHQALEHIKEAEQAAKMCGVRACHIIPGVALPVADDAGTQGVVDALCNEAHGGNLILGAGGRECTIDESVSLQCMGKSRAPVILCKPKGTPMVDSVRGMTMRKDGRVGTTIVVTVDGGTISQKCFDMALRFVQPKDRVIALTIKNTDKSVTNANAVSNSLLGFSSIENYYKGECAKAAARFDRSEFSFVSLRLGRSGVANTILQYCETEDVLADMIIIGSVEMGKPKADSMLGSVAATVAKKAPCHVLVAKHFA